MGATFWIMTALAGLLSGLAYAKDPVLALEGLKDGGGMFLQLLPVLIPAFIAAGMMPKVIPQESLSRWMGEESGWRGLLVGTGAGMITPGGPFVQFPLVAALFKAGAGVAPLMAYITAWSLLGLNRFLVFEIPLLGWKLSLARFAAALAFPLLLGWLTRLVYLRL